MSEKYKVHNQDSPHFVTFAVESWIDVFTRQAYRDIVLDSLRHCQREKGLMIYAWCLMSNHIHLIVGRNKEIDIPDIIRDFKKFTSVHLCKAIEDNPLESRREWILKLLSDAAVGSSKHQKYKFWESEYHPVELWSENVVYQKLDYIHNNPVKEGIVDRAEDYLYSSARDYQGVTGLLKVEFII